MILFRDLQHSERVCKKSLQCLWFQVLQYSVLLLKSIHCSHIFSRKLILGICLKLSQFREPLDALKDGRACNAHIWWDYERSLNLDDDVRGHEAWPLKEWHIWTMAGRYRASYSELAHTQGALSSDNEPYKTGFTNVCLLLIYSRQSSGDKRWFLWPTCQSHQQTRASVGALKIFWQTELI
jgi:hypothetical protein